VEREQWSISATQSDIASLCLVLRHLSFFSEMAESVKSKFVPSGRGGDYLERGKEQLMGKRGGLMEHEDEHEGSTGFLGSILGGGGGRGGVRRGYSDEDEVNEATQKLRRVVRQADRDL